MAVQRSRVVFAALLLAAALQVSTVSAQSAELTSSTFASSNSAFGSASASSNLRITSGEGSSVAFASSQAYSEAKNQIVSIIQRVVDVIPKPQNPVDKSQYCPDVAEFVEVEAKAIGLAGARVTVDVVSDVIIDGQGSGCSSSEATGEAFAVAFADLFVDAIVTTGINGIDSATAKAVLRAKSDAFAAAFAEATAAACLDGSGAAIAEQSVEAEALARPIASILVFLEAFVDCSGFSDSFAEAEVGALLDEVVTNVSQTGFSSIDGAGSAETTAAAFATTGRVCSGNFGNCCKRSRAKALGNGGICYCNGLNRKIGAQCEAKKNILSDGSIFFEDQNSDFACACSEIL